MAKVPATGALEADLIADLQADDDEVRTGARDFGVSDTESSASKPSQEAQVPGHSSRARAIWKQDALSRSSERRGGDTAEARGETAAVSAAEDGLFLLSQPDRSQLKALLACAGSPALLDSIPDFQSASREPRERISVAAPIPEPFESCSSVTADAVREKKALSACPDVSCPERRKTAAAVEGDASDEAVNTSNRLDEPFLLPLLLGFLGVPMYGRLCCVSKSLKEACEGRYSRVDSASPWGRVGPLTCESKPSKTESTINSSNPALSKVSQNAPRFGLTDRGKSRARLLPVNEAFIPENGEFWLSFLRRRFAGAFSEELELLEGSRRRAQGDKSALESDAAREARQLLRTAEAARQEAHRVSLQVELRRQKLEREERIAEHDLRERQAKAEIQSGRGEGDGTSEVVFRCRNSTPHQGDASAEGGHTRLQLDARKCFRGELRRTCDRGRQPAERDGEKAHAEPRDKEGEVCAGGWGLTGPEPSPENREGARRRQPGRHSHCDAEGRSDLTSDVFNMSERQGDEERPKRQRVVEGFRDSCVGLTHKDISHVATAGKVVSPRPGKKRQYSKSFIDPPEFGEDSTVSGVVPEGEHGQTKAIISRGEPVEPGRGCTGRGKEPAGTRQQMEDRIESEATPAVLGRAAAQDGAAGREQDRGPGGQLSQTIAEHVEGRPGVTTCTFASYGRDGPASCLVRRTDVSSPVHEGEESSSVPCPREGQETSQGERLFSREDLTRLGAERRGRCSPDDAFTSSPCTEFYSLAGELQTVVSEQADGERRESDTSLSLWSQLLKEEDELRRRDATPPSAFIALWREGPRRHAATKGFLGGGTDDVDALLQCTSARLSCMVLVTSSKIMDRWRELGLLTGWRWFQRKVLRRMTRAQLERWAVKADGAAPAMGGKNTRHSSEKTMTTDADDVGASATDSIDLPEELALSSDHIAWKMTTANWELLYESVQAEMGYRARLYSEKLVRLHERLVVEVGELVEDRLDLEQHLLCLPCFSGDSGRPVPDELTGYEEVDPSPRDSSRQPAAHQMKNFVPRWKRCIPLLRKATPGAFSLIRGLNEAWDEYEEWAEMACRALDCLDFRVTQEREACDQRWPHTPNLGDVARLQFRTFIIFDSRLMPCICVSVYALIHELEEQLNRSSMDGCAPEVTGKQQSNDALEETVDQPVTRQASRSAPRSASASGGRFPSRARSASAMELFEAVMQRFEELDVADDGLMSRVTRQEFRMFLMTPIRETFNRLSYASWNVCWRPS